MYKSLYDIQTDYAALITDLIDLEGELTPELEFALQINFDELEKKAEAYALRILEFQGQADLLKLEIDRLSKRVKHYENTASRLKGLIQSAMEQFKVDKIKTTKVTLSLRKSEVTQLPEDFAASVLEYVSLKATLDAEKIQQAVDAATAAGAAAPAIPDESLLQYFKIKAEPDKTKIKEALRGGTPVGDCMILTNKNLQIK